MGSFASYAIGKARAGSPGPVFLLSIPVLDGVPAPAGLSPRQVCFQCRGWCHLAHSGHLRRVCEVHTLAFYLRVSSPSLTGWFLLFQHVTYSSSLSICGIIEWMYAVATGSDHRPWILHILCEGHVHLTHVQKIALLSRELHTVFKELQQYVQPWSSERQNCFLFEITALNMLSSCCDSLSPVETCWTGVSGLAGGEGG